MKKVLVLMLLTLFFLPSFTALAEDGEWGNDGEWTAGEEGFYDDIEISIDDTRYIWPATKGAVCDMVYVGGWTVFMGYGVNEAGEYDWGIIGMPDDGEEIIMLEGDSPVGIVPSGESFVYYSLGADGKHHWFARKPGEKPVVLPLTWHDSVFYGDENGIWFVTSTGASLQDVYSISLNGKNRHGLFQTRGDIVGVLQDGSILLVDYSQDTVSAWKDKKTTTLFSSPKEDIRAVAATSGSVWVMYEDHFGRIADGALRDTQAGYAMDCARSGEQLVLLVLDEYGANEARVILINDAINAWTELGRIPYSKWMRVELSLNCVIVWGQESRMLSIPEGAEGWIEYEN